MIKIERAILSVSDKTGIIELAKVLKKYNVEIISTGGTAKILKENKIDVIEVSQFTGFPEILDGRVKTLHPKIYGGILSIKDNPEHLKQINQHNIPPIQLIVCNLYPFEKTLKSGKSDEEIIENIDIGGPTIIRAGAKNYKYVCVLVKPEMYDEFIKEIEDNNGSITEEFSFKCAKEVFKLTSRYDHIIFTYFSGKIEKEILPSEINIHLIKVCDLRYGENPHQKGAWYRFIDKEFKREIFQGKELSFNNLLDLESAYNLVWQFEKPSCVIIKHTNPCGVASGKDLIEAYEKALECDPLSAFGGIVGFNSKVDKQLAEILIKRFYEIVVAPDYENTALEIFKERQNLRVIKCFKKIKYDYDFKTLSDGFLVQTPDDIDYEKFEVVTEKKPNQDEIEALKFGWKVCKFIKSNGIVISTKDQILGIGTGQMSRYDSTRIAVMKMKDNFKEIPKPVVLASDAFFPFSDSIEVASKAGVSAIIQPGGSNADKEIIKKCNELGISMVFTGTRHFKH
ncbi:MAG: bifunctional phosphoribosylaminoimidazolecarboxamide formyltransferase/IMP cyclohydrolase [Candidatus Omnitrophica bacterium]|nr:bifunctional phosphoribosylaminoimidazolecarboxamide formyltransferase/IMP cyclohydrolase [Candidatus Omnitrophota bacterium]MCM8809448.1 bifunctional phosphoribosylaminoimidazolecarboxamide formyltransferase/IMP cyclohydrolase [Candidatus Omnitrophota bacterium]MCM8810696.1 bifunctional phosphoribosylaminoimidazolecarboxamide formyltransferase/IMP cyclohydrolase [Candidatus Omnitrophota bacterium]MCM8832382.1 bifunctional phosphoribosylaminoimidazolecarboxamide formyltransferase/IMP cyclohyd